MAHTTFMQGTDTHYEPTGYQSERVGVTHRHETLSLMYAYYSKHIQSLHESFVEIPLAEAIPIEEDFNESTPIALSPEQQERIQDYNAQATHATTIIDNVENTTLPVALLASDDDIKDNEDLAALSKATLIEGVDTLGFNVYHKIGEGLADQLRAIASGETTLNLVGHSRGAVECILVAHELDRIQKIVQANPHLSNEELKATILASPKQGTGQAVSNLLAEELQNTAFLAALRTGFNKTDDNKLEVNIFGIDPVPGSGIFGINILAWVDQRFYTLPPIVKDCEIILQEHERSRAFEALLPKVEDPSKTNLTVTKVYGHHGSSTGNPDTQTEEEIEQSRLEDPSTGDVQIIALYRMADFLRQHKAVASGFHPQFPIESTITTKFNTYLDLTTDADRNAFKLSAYSRAEMHRETYERFKYTTYATGRLYSNRDRVWSIFGYDEPDRERMIHHGNNNHTPMGQIVPVGVRGFMNTEHATLHLESLLNNNSDNPEYTLQNIIKRIQTDPSRLERAIKVQSGEETAQAEIAESITNSIRLIISDLTTTYLRNHISEAKQEDILKTLRTALTMPAVEGDEYARLNTMITDLKQHLLQELSGAIRARVAYYQHEVTLLQERMTDTTPEALPALYASVVATLLDLQSMKMHLPHLKDAMPIESSHKEKAACGEAIAALAVSFNSLWSTHATILSETLQAQLSVIDAKRRDIEQLNHVLAHKETVISTQTVGLHEIKANMEQLSTYTKTLRESITTYERDVKKQTQEHAAILAEKLQAQRDVLESNHVEIKRLNQVLKCKEELISQQSVGLREAASHIHQLNTKNDAQRESITTYEQSIEKLTQDNTEQLKLCDDLQQNLDALLATINTQHACLKTLGLNSDADNIPQYGLAFEILGAVIVAAGLAIATMALLAITLMSIINVPSGAALTVGLGLATAGFFSFRHGAQQEHQAALHARAYPDAVI